MVDNQQTQEKGPGLAAQLSILIIQPSEKITIQMNFKEGKTNLTSEKNEDKEAENLVLHFEILLENSPVQNHEFIWALITWSQVTIAVIFSLVILSILSSLNTTQALVMILMILHTAGYTKNNNTET